MATKCFFGFHSNFFCGCAMKCMMDRLNNSYYKLTSLFHQDGKGSVSWWLNITNVNIKINISVVIMRASSHETSREIDEFRVHSTPPKIIKMNNIVLTIWNNKWGTETISFEFPTCSGFGFRLGTRVPSLKSCGVGLLEAVPAFPVTPHSVLWGRSETSTAKCG